MFRAKALRREVSRLPTVPYKNALALSSLNHGVVTFVSDCKDMRRLFSQMTFAVFCHNISRVKPFNSPVGINS
jgi:hypothetical protein